MTGRWYDERGHYLSTVKPAQVNLRAIPELVDRQAAAGHPIVVDDPGTDHGRALVLKLGAMIRPRRP